MVFMSVFGANSHMRYLSTAVSNLASLVATLDRHPFGALACIVLAGMLLAGVIAMRRAK